MISEQIPCTWLLQEHNIQEYGESSLGKINTLVLLAQVMLAADQLTELSRRLDGRCNMTHRRSLILSLHASEGLRTRTSQPAGMDPKEGATSFEYWTAFGWYDSSLEIYTLKHRLVCLATRFFNSNRAKPSISFRKSGGSIKDLWNEIFSSKI